MCMQRGLLLALTGLLLVTGIAAWWWSGQSSGTSLQPAGGKQPGGLARNPREQSTEPTVLVAPAPTDPGGQDAAVAREADEKPTSSTIPPTSEGEVLLPNMADTTGDRARRPIVTQPVVLYEHATHDADFPGRSWNLVPGLTNAGPTFADDEASSLKVPDGLLVTLFEDFGGAGARVALGSGTHNLAPYSFNDRVSSVRVSRSGQDVEIPKGLRDTVLLYEHLPRKGGPAGKVWKLPLDEENQRLFTAQEDHFMAHAASAAWVPLGVVLTLFEQPDGRGRAMVMGPGFHELALLGFNDRASSARVRRAGD